MMCEVFGKHSQTCRYIYQQYYWLVKFKDFDEYEVKDTKLRLDHFFHLEELILRRMCRDDRTEYSSVWVSATHLAVAAAVVKSAVLSCMTYMYVHNYVEQYDYFHITLFLDFCCCFGQTRDIEGSEDDTYIVSAQSATQRQLIGQSVVTRVHGVCCMSLLHRLHVHLHNTCSAK